MTIDFHEYRKLKQYLLDKGYKEIHLHDVCGGEYFSIDDPDDETCAAIEKYFEKKGKPVNFSANRTEFTIGD